MVQVRLLPEIAIHRTLFGRKRCFCVKIALFAMFSGDKDDYVNVWIVKIKIKTNHMDMVFASSKTRQ